MKEDLKRRLPKRSDEYIDAIEHLVNLFGIRPTIRNFMNSSFSFQDLDGRTVELVDSEIRSGSINFNSKTPAEILAFCSGSVLLGWSKAEKAVETATTQTMSIKTLDPLPPTNQFRQQCTHLADNGGWYDGQAWECLGCGAELVFNDRRFTR